MQTLKNWLRLSSKTAQLAYGRSMLFWNPILSFVICLFLDGTDNFFKRWVWSYLFACICTNVSFGAVYFSRYFDRKIAQRKKNPAPLRSREWYYLLATCAMFPGVYIAYQVMSYLAPYLQMGVFTPNADSYRISLLIGFLIAALFFFMSSRSEAREEARKAQLKLKQIENERLQAQLAALTAQMNPHLLFNALNTVASLVQTDPQKAEEVIVKLSELYRGVLDSSRKMTHSLATELRICEAYLEVEKARFGDRLKTKIELEPSVDANRTQIPALCLQPLIENAVKHGLSSRSSGGEICLRAANTDGILQIHIQDNGIGFRNSSLLKKAGSGVGLKNCQERLQLHYGELSSFVVTDAEGGGTAIQIRMPAILQKEDPA